MYSLRDVTLTRLVNLERNDCAPSFSTDFGARNELKTDGDCVSSFLFYFLYSIHLCESNKDISKLTFVGPSWRSGPRPDLEDTRCQEKVESEFLNDGTLRLHSSSKLRSSNFGRTRYTVFGTRILCLCF